jgi:hypothetical protein
LTCNYQYKDIILLFEFQSIPVNIFFYRAQSRKFVDAERLAKKKISTKQFFYALQQDLLVNKQFFCAILQDLLVIKQLFIAILQDLPAIKSFICAIQQDLFVIKQFFIAIQQDLFVIKQFIYVFLQDLLVIKQFIFYFRQDLFGVCSLNCGSATVPAFAQTAQSPQRTKPGSTLGRLGSYEMLTQF